MPHAPFRGQRKSTVILISVVSTIVVYSTVVSFLVSAVRYNAAYSGKSWFSKLGSGDVGAVGAAGTTGTNLAAAAPPMPAAPSNDGPTEFTTRSQCASMGSWGDVCVYEDVCFDGTHWLFVDPSLPSGNLRQTFSLTSVLPDNDLLPGYLFPGGNPGRRQVSNHFPLNAGPIKGAAIKPSVLADAKVTWTNSTVWRTSHDPSISLNDQYHFASRVMPIYKALAWNASGMLPFILPPLDNDAFLLMPSAQESEFKDLMEWPAAVLGNALRPNTPSVVMTSGKWASQWSPSNVLCMRSAVISGMFPYVVPDLQTGFEFRKAVYAAQGLEVPEKSAPKVLLYLPRDAQQPISNLPELIALMDYYNQTYTIVKQEVTSFAEYIKLVSSHGVVITTHGTSMMMTMFMVPFSAIIELFPFRVDSALYPAMATQVAVGNYPVHAPNNTVMEADEAFKSKGCHLVPAMEVLSGRQECRVYATAAPFMVDPRDFEAALVNAVQHSGYRLRFRNIRPVPSNTTETGWMR